MSDTSDTNHIRGAREGGPDRVSVEPDMTPEAHDVARRVATHSTQTINAPAEIVVSDIRTFWDLVSARGEWSKSMPMPIKIRVEGIRRLPAPDFSRVSASDRFGAEWRPLAVIDMRNVDFGHATLTGDWRNCVFANSMLGQATLAGSFHVPFLQGAYINWHQRHLIMDIGGSGHA